MSRLSATIATIVIAMIGVFVLGDDSGKIPDLTFYVMGIYTIIRIEALHEK